jgi:hypothetical protein
MLAAPTVSAFKQLFTAQNEMGCATSKGHRADAPRRKRKDRRKPQLSHNDEFSSAVLDTSGSLAGSSQGQGNGGRVAAGLRAVAGTMPTADKGKQRRGRAARGTYAHKAAAVDGPPGAPPVANPLTFERYVPAPRDDRVQPGRSTPSASVSVSASSSMTTPFFVLPKGLTLLSRAEPAPSPSTSAVIALDDPSTCSDTASSAGAGGSELQRRGSSLRPPSSAGSGKKKVSFARPAGGGDDGGAEPPQPRRGSASIRSTSTASAASTSRNASVVDDRDDDENCLTDDLPVEPSAGAAPLLLRPRGCSSRIATPRVRARSAAAHRGTELIPVAIPGPVGDAPGGQGRGKRGAGLNLLPPLQRPPTSVGGAAQ